VRLIRIRLVLVNLNPINDTYIPHLDHANNRKPKMAGTKVQSLVFSKGPGYPPTLLEKVHVLVFRF